MANKKFVIPGSYIGERGPTKATRQVSFELLPKPVKKRRGRPSKVKVNSKATQTPAAQTEHLMVQIETSKEKDAFENVKIDKNVLNLVRDYCDEYNEDIQSFSTNAVVEYLRESWKEKVLSAKLILINFVDVEAADEAKHALLYSNIDVSEIENPDIFKRNVMLDCYNLESITFKVRFNSKVSNERKSVARAFDFATKYNFAFNEKPARLDSQPSEPKLKGEYEDYMRDYRAYETKFMSWSLRREDAKDRWTYFLGMNGFQGIVQILE